MSGHADMHDRLAYLSGLLATMALGIALRGALGEDTTADRQRYQRFLDRWKDLAQRADTTHVRSDR